MTIKSKPIADIVTSKALRIFVASGVLQVLVLFFSIVYFSYEEAISRTDFLVKSSQDSLGLLMSLGDRFQLINIVKSFSSSETSAVWLLDREGALIAASDRGIKPENENGMLNFDRGEVQLWRKFDIDYNGQHYGTLLMLSKVKIKRWFVVISAFILLASTFFLVQIKSLENLSLRVGRSITEIAALFSKGANEAEIIEQHSKRTPSEFDEVEILSVRMRDLLVRAMNSAILEKEAEIGRISTQLSHDLRGPLGSFERLLSMPLGEQVADHVPLIRESLNRLHAMIESLRYSDRELLISRQGWVADFSSGIDFLSGRASDRGIRIQVAEIPNLVLNVDPLKFERAWINLASNAIDFAKAEVRIEVDRHDSDLVLRIIDDGPGVAAEILPKLFQRGATHGKHDGTGLGLAYVRQIMRGHGGDVTYRRENDLTIFECRLPNAVEPEKDQAVENAASLEIPAVQKQVRVVAICLEPETLSKSVRSKLASHNSEIFSFIEEREQAHIVVSNVEDIMIEVLEADDKEFVSVVQFKGDESRIVEILKHKFKLV